MRLGMTRVLVLVPMAREEWMSEEEVDDDEDEGWGGGEGLDGYGCGYG